MEMNSSDTRIKYFLLTLFIIFSTCASAQLNNVWYFGNKAGISFNAPVTAQQIPYSIANNAMIADEGCASVCDTLGNLLFYTNGVAVYNRIHELMLNGDGLLGHLSAVQSAIIVPHPGNAALYYIFTTDALEANFAKGYNYSIVDISHDGGLGEVVSKNNLLHSSCTERMAAVRHADGTSVWLITNDNNSNIFRAWLINCQGLQPVPVISASGTVMDQHLFVSTGMLKASPDGKQICQTHFPFLSENSTPPNFIQLFDFNNLTGVLSNNRTIGFPDSKYTSCEFSPNSKLLYLLRTHEKMVDQLEITLPGTAAIIASRYSFQTNSNNYGIQLAPDGKIYLAATSNRFLAAINSPDSKGGNCNFNNSQIILSDGGAIAGLPSFINDISGSSGNDILTTITDSCNGVVRFSTNGTLSPPLIYEWDFGDGIKSNLPDPVHTFTPKDKNYTVRLKISSAIQCGTARSSKLILPTGASAVNTAFRTFGGCDSGYIRFELITPPPVQGTGGQFIWTFGDGQTTNILNPTHVYSQPGNYTVKLKYKTTTACLDDSTEIDINMLKLNGTLITSGNKTILFAKGPGNNYSWSPSSGLSNSATASPTASPSVTTTYKIINTNNTGCYTEDSLKITVVDLTDVYIPTAFTPNNDGKNDQIYPLMGNKFTLKEYSIFTRWGQKIFTTTMQGTGWDGKLNGVQQNSGTYIWVLSFLDQTKNTVIEKKGSFTLIR
jgi:gliding motility-associated-like protein